MWVGVAVGNAEEWRGWPGERPNAHQVGGIGGL
jgi:hypothetical protein